MTPSKYSYKITGSKSATTRTLIGYWTKGACLELDNGNADVIPRVDFGVQIVVYECYFDNSAAELFCKKGISKKTTSKF